MVRHGTGARAVKQSRLVRIRSLAAVLFFIAASAFAQEDLQVEVSDPQIRQGESVTVRIAVDFFDPQRIRVDEPDYPPALRKISGPTIETSYASLSGTLPRQTSLVTFEFRGTEAGRAVLPPFVITYGDTTVRTQPALIEISERNNPDRIPFDLLWYAGVDRVYEGQTVPVYLEIANIPTFTFPDSIDIRQPSGALFEEVQGLGAVVSQTFGDTELFRFPVATFLLTPSSTGTLTIPAARVKALGFDRSAAPLRVPVERIPEAARQTGAVGQFTVSSRISSRRVGPGESVVVSMEVKGEGNLDYFQFPEVESETMVQTDSSETAQTEPSPSGYRGFRRLDVQLSPRSLGVHTVDIPPFVWFDPQSGVVHRTAARQFSVEAVSAAAQDSGGEVARIPFAALNAEQVAAVQPLDLFERPVAYLLFAPGILLCVVFLLLKRRKKKLGAAVTVGLFIVGSTLFQPLPTDLINLGYEAYQAGNSSAAVEHFEAARDNVPDSPGILYNLGLAYYADGQLARALYSMRSAVKHNPALGDARSALSWMEQQKGLERQVAPPQLLHPDVFFILSVVLFYAVCALLLLPQRRKSGFYYIYLITAVLLFGISLAGIPFMAARMQRQVAVVGPADANLKRIPEESAENWLSLPVGTSLSPQVAHDGFYLVRTGFGIEGWIQRNSVIGLPEPGKKRGQEAPSGE